MATKKTSQEFARELYKERQRANTQDRVNQLRRGLNNMAAEAERDKQRINSLLSDYETEYSKSIDTYNNRFVNNNNYRGDASGALRFATESNNKLANIESEAKKLIDKWGNKLGKDYVSSVNNFFTTASKTSKDILDTYTNDFNYMSKFKDEKEYNTIIANQEKEKKDQEKRIAEIKAYSLEDNEAELKKMQGYLSRVENGSFGKKDLQKFGYANEQALRNAIREKTDEINNYKVDSKRYGINDNKSPLSLSFPNREKIDKLASLSPDAVPRTTLTPPENLYFSNDKYKNILGRAYGEKQRGKDYNFADGEAVALQEGFYEANPQVKFETFATEEEKQIYSELVAEEGRAVADAYRASIDNELNNRLTNTLYELKYKDSAYLKTTQAAQSGFTGAVENIATYVDSAIKTSQGKPIDIDVDLDQLQFAVNSQNSKGIGKVALDAINTISAQGPAILSSFIPGVGAAAASATFFGSAAGGAIKEAKAKGYTDDQAMLYANLVGISELAIERYLGAVPGVSKLSGKISKLVSGLDDALWKLIGHGVLSATSEGLEEGIQTFIEPAIAMIVEGGDYDAPTWSEVAYSSLLGAISGAGFGAATVATTPTTNNMGSTTETPVPYQAAEPITMASNVVGEQTPTQTNNPEKSASQSALDAALDTKNLTEESKTQARTMFRDVDGVDPNSEEAIARAENFVEDFETAVMAGRVAQETGETIPDLVNEGYVTTLTEEQTKAAIDSGRIEALSKTEAYNNMVSQSVLQIRENTNKLIKSGKLSDAQKTAVKIAEKLNTAVGFYNSADIFDGQVDGIKTKSGTIFMDFNTQDPVRQVFVHELTHFTENSKSYSKLKNAILNSKELDRWLSNKKTSGSNALARLDNYLSNIQSRYAKRGVELSDADAQSELIAQFLGEHFSSEERFNSLLKSFGAQEKQGFVEWVKTAISKIKTALKGEAMPKELREIEKWCQKALKESAEGMNGVTEQKKGESKTSWSMAEETSYSEYDKPIILKAVQSLRAIGRKSINAFTDSDIKASAKWAYKFFQELGTKSPFFRAWFGDWRAFDTSTTQIVEASRTEGKNPRGTYKNKDTGWNIVSSSVGYDETVSHSGRDKLSIRAMQNIDKVIENSILLDTEVSEFGRGKKSEGTAFIHKFYSLVNIDNKLYIAKMSVDESYQPKQDTYKKFYHVRTIKMSPASSVGTGFNQITHLLNAGDNVIISDLFNLVKTYDKEFKPHPVNKILLNDDGTPKVFYHGTRAQFTTFDKKKAKPGLYGRGFYFTDTASQANVYGKNMAVYLKMESPLIPGKSSITKEQIKNFLNAVAENEDYSIENYGTYNVSEIAKKIASRDAFEAIQDINATAIGDMGEAIELFNKVNGTDYDGVVTPTEAVVYTPEQIKSAESNIGTFNKYDADIRFSIPKTSETTSARIELANALETVAETEADQKIIETYRKNIESLDKAEAELKALRQERGKLSFAEGPKDVVRLKELGEKITALSKQINRQDRALLNLEASAPLKSLTEREKNAAKKSVAKKYQEARKKNVESRQKTKIKAHIAKKFNDMNRWLLSQTKENHIPENMRSAVAYFLDVIDFGKVDRYISDIETLENRLATTRDYEEFDELFTTLRKKEAKKEALENALTKMQIAYGDIQKSSDSIIKDAFDEEVLAKIEKARIAVIGKRIYDLTKPELEILDEAITAMHKRITEANKLFNDEIKRTRTEIGRKVETELETQRNSFVRLVNRTKGLTFLLKPVTFFENIGSQTLNMLYKYIEKAESQKFLDAEKAKEYAKEAGKKFNASKWDTTTRIKISAANGTTLGLKLGEVMSLYAYSKRPQARQHLEVGGFELSEAAFEEWQKRGDKSKNEDVLSFFERMSASNKVSILDETSFNDIENALTDEQKAFVDYMVKYLSVDMAELGNTVTMKRYGIKGFRENYYLPIVSSSNFLSFYPDKTADPQILNSGFTKELNPEATNPLVLFDFMELWGKHVDNMTTYANFALPVEDLQKAYNFRNVKKDIEVANGAEWNSYIKQLFKDINNSVSSDVTTGFINLGLKWFKIGSTGLSASVVVQQPSSLPRAFAYIEPKYFLPFYNTKKKEARVTKRMKKHSGLAVLKDIGGYDTGLGKGTPDYITGKKRFTDIMSTVVGFLPQGADKLTWSYLWFACENKVTAETDLEYNTEEYWNKVTEIFEDAIRHSQVYDSTLSRSQYMRSKDTGAKMVTAFMAEPTTILNMAYDAVIKASTGNRKAANNIICSVATSVMLNNILRSLVYASRDDDDDESYTEKLLESVITEAIEDFNVVSYIPIAKDFWSLLLGYSVERSDLSFFGKLADEIKNVVINIVNDKVTPEDWVRLLTRFVTPIIPAYNVYRDVKAAQNIIYKMPKGASKMGYAAAVRTAIRKSIPVLSWFNDPYKKADALYDSLLCGDKTYHNRLKGTYKTDEAYNNALVNGLKNNDGRIIKAAECLLSNNVGERVDVIKEIEGEGFFDLKTIQKAVKSVASGVTTKIDKAKEYEKEGDTKNYEKIIVELRNQYSDELINSLLNETKDEEEINETTDAYYSNKDLGRALEQEDMDAYSEAYEERYNYYIKKGKTEKEAKASLRSAVTSYWKPLYLEAYAAGNEADMNKIKEKLEQSDLYGTYRQLNSTLSDWEDAYEEEK